MGVADTQEARLLGLRVHEQTEGACCERGKKLGFVVTPGCFVGPDPL
jgi:hypothetical protein